MSHGNELCGENTQFPDSATAGWRNLEVKLRILSDIEKLLWYKCIIEQNLFSSKLLSLEWNRFRSENTHEAGLQTTANIDQSSSAPLQDLPRFIKARQRIWRLSGSLYRIFALHWQCPTFPKDRKCKINDQHINNPWKVRQHSTSDVLHPLQQNGGEFFFLPRRVELMLPERWLDDQFQELQCYMRDSLMLVFIMIAKLKK